MKRYFVADCDEDGEAISESIFETPAPPSLRAVVEAFVLGAVIGVGVTVILL